MRKVLFLFFCLSGLAFGQIQNQWIILSGYGPTLPGALRYSSGAFQGYNGSSWHNLLNGLDTNAIHNELSLKLPIADSSLYTTRWHADSSLATKVKYSDSTIVFFTPTQALGKLNKSDSTIYSTRFHTDSSLATKLSRSDSLIYATRYHLDSLFLADTTLSTGVFKSDSTVVFFTPTQALSKLNRSDSAIYSTRFHADSSLGTKLNASDSTKIRNYSNLLYQPAGTYLIPSDSVSIRNRSNILYQPLGTYLVPSDSVSIRNRSNVLYQPTLTIGNLSASPPLSQTGGTGAVIGTGVTVSADTTVLATHSYVQNLAAGLFEYDANGDLEPATATVYDAFFTTDINGDIEPKP